MPGFDWNGNGRSDSFDRYMDMKAMSGASGTKGKPGKVSSSSTKKSSNRADPSDRKSDSAGVTIIKSILAIGLCVAGFAIMFSVGGLIGVLALIGAALLGYAIMNS